MKQSLSLFLAAVLSLSTGCTTFSKERSHTPHQSFANEYAQVETLPTNGLREISNIKLGDFEFQNVVRALQASPTAADTEFKVCIKTADITLEADSIVDCSQKIGKLVKTFKGEMVANYQNSENYSTLNLRIPSQSLEKFIENIKENYTVSRLDVESKDVTEHFVDTASRLKTQKALLKRLQELLTKAEKVKEILEIEREIGRIQADIEAKENTLKTLAGKASMSGVEINIDRKTILGPLGAIYAGAEWFFEKLFIIQG